MTEEEITDRIYRVLRDRLQWPHLAAFNTSARLNEDLYLDSILMLQLILHLELDHGVEVTDEALAGRDLRTVGQFAAALCRVPRVEEQPATETDRADAP